MARTKDMGVSSGERSFDVSKTADWRREVKLLRRRPSPPMSSPRKRGPITTERICWAELWLQLTPYRTSAAMGPGSRGACHRARVRATRWLARDDGRLRRRGRHTAVDHDGLAGHEGGGIGGEIGHGARDLVGLADPAKRRGGTAALQALLVLPQCAREIGLHQARRHAIDAHALRAPFAGKAAGERKVGGLGDAVGADHG